MAKNTYTYSVSAQISNGGDVTVNTNYYSIDSTNAVNGKTQYSYYTESNGNITETTNTFTPGTDGDVLIYTNSTLTGTDSQYTITLITFDGTSK